MRRSTERGLVVLLILVTASYALAETVTVTSYYPAPRGIYNQLRTWSQTTFAEQGGNVGINTADPREALQIGDRFTFHSGGFKVIGYNYDQSGADDIRLVDDEVAAVRFTDEGDIHFDTAPFGAAGSTFTNAWIPGIAVENVEDGGNVGIGTWTPAEKLHVTDNVHISAGDFPDIRLGDAGCGAGFSGITFAGLAVDCKNYAFLGSATDTFVNRPAGGTLYFREHNNTEMLIKPGGNVGIGSLDPKLDKLQVETSSHAIALYVGNSNSAGVTTGLSAYASGGVPNTGLLAAAFGGTENTAIMIPGGYPAFIAGQSNNAIRSESEAQSFVSGKLAVTSNVAVAGTLTWTPTQLLPADDVVVPAMIWGGSFVRKEPENQPCPIPDDTSRVCREGNPLVPDPNNPAKFLCECPLQNVLPGFFKQYLMGKFEGAPQAILVNGVWVDAPNNRCLYGCYR